MGARATGSAGTLLAGRYRLVEPLPGAGAGWRARDDLGNRDVVARELAPADAPERVRERAAQEAREAARLRHPGIAQVLDVVEHEDAPWAVAELVPAVTLDQLLRSHGPLPPVEAARIAVRVLDAIEAADAAGVRHRDLTPVRVLVADDGRVWVAGFGQAAEPEQAPGRAAAVSGSVDFLAPERARGIADAGLPADLWSLGAILYAAVEGKLPFHRDATLATLTAVVTDEPPPPRRAGPLRPVIDGLLIKDPAHRLGLPRARHILETVVGGAPPAPRPRPPDGPGGVSGGAADAVAGGSGGAGAGSVGVADPTGTAGAPVERGGAAGPGGTAGHGAGPAETPEQAPGTTQAAGTAQAGSPMQAAGTAQAAGTTQATGTTQAGSPMQAAGTAQAAGTTQAAGTAQATSIASAAGPAQAESTARAKSFAVAGGAGTAAGGGGTAAGGATGSTMAPADGDGAVRPRDHGDQQDLHHEIRDPDVAAALAAFEAALAPVMPASRPPSVPAPAPEEPAAAQPPAGEPAPPPTAGGPAATAGETVGETAGETASAPPSPASPAARGAPPAGPPRTGRPAADPRQDRPQDRPPRAGQAQRTAPGSSPTGPVRPKPLKADPTRADTKADPTRSDPTRTDPARADAEADPTRADTKADPSGADPTRTGPTRTGPTRTDPSRTGPTRTGLNRAGPAGSRRPEDGLPVVSAPGAPAPPHRPVNGHGTHPVPAARPLGGTGGTTANGRPANGHRPSSPPRAPAPGPAPTHRPILPPPRIEELGGDRASRRRSLLTVLAVVAAVLAAVLIPFIIDRARGEDGPPRPEAGPSPAPTSAAETASPAAAAPPPAGFVLHRDPTGFSLAVPRGWRQERSGTAVDFRDPASSRFIRVDQRADPSTEPYDDWVSREPTYKAGLPGYDLIRIANVAYRGWPTADWEFTWGASGSERSHVLIRNVVPNQYHGYALYWSTADVRWTRDLQYFEVFVRTFAPKPGR